MARGIPALLAAGGGIPPHRVGVLHRELDPEVRKDFGSVLVIGFLRAGAVWGIAGSKPMTVEREGEGAGKDGQKETGGWSDPEGLVSILEEVKERAERLCQQFKEQREKRQGNLDVTHPSDDELKKCESSVKRNAALIKKLRGISEESRNSLCEEILKVNQSRYVSEAVVAIAETPIKSKDIPAAIQVCTLLHNRYSDFRAGIVDALVKSLNGANKSAGDDEKVIGSRRRSCVRLLVELLLCGVHQNLSVLHSVLKELVVADYHSNQDGYLLHLLLLTTFSKAGRDQLLGLPHKPRISLPIGVEGEEGDGVPEAVQPALRCAKAALLDLEAEQSKRFMAPEEDRRQFRDGLERAFSVASSTLVTEHADLRQQEQDNMHVLNTRGELPEEMAAQYEKKRKAFEALQRNMSAFAESLDKDLPDLPDDSLTRVTTDSQATGGDLGDDSGPPPLFDDAETQAFYETLPDLRALVPAVLLGVAEDKDKDEEESTPRKADGKKEEVSKKLEGKKAAKKGEGKEEGGEKGERGGEDGAKKGEGNSVEEGVKKDGGRGADEGKETEGEGKAADKVMAKDGRARASNQELDALLSRLPTCVTRDSADEISVNFCYLNSKAARKRLMRALCDVPKGSLQLLSFFARIAATLKQVYPDIANGVCQYLEEEFAALLTHKDPTEMTLEPRIRNMRYIGELCKFRIIPFGTVFIFLKQLLDDFVHHSIDAACALIETAGSFLIRLPETQIRMENMLEVMMRLKNAKTLDNRQKTLVDSAYFVCKPPRSGARRKRRPPIHAYIRHLIYNVLMEDSILYVLKKLRRVPWAEYEYIIVRCLVKAAGRRFSHVSLVASLCAGLTKYHDTLAIRIVDEVLEEMQNGLEYPSFGLYQRRVAHVRLLGELYNYRLLDSRTLFESLYWILNFGHDTPEDAMRLDPPGDTFRIRMICTLLDTCGRYFSKGTAKRKLDRFLSFFQRYILSKPPLSLDVEYDITDLLERLRSDLKRRCIGRITGNGLAPCLHADDDSASSSASEEGGERDGGEDAMNTADENDGVGLDDDDVAVGFVRKATPETDEEFERDLKSLLQDYQGRRVVSLSSPSGQAPPESPAADEGPQVSVPFKMLMKKGGRDDRSRELQVPMSVSLAAHQVVQEDLEALERSKIKELVLAANVRAEQEQLAAAGVPPIRRMSDRGRAPYTYGGRRYSSSRKRR
eukprot:evm.model.scf_755.1 EVM.evm.TU.scf_755.1   scf_755:18101-34941(-)